MALATDGKLIKRPLVVGENLAIVGFRPAEYEQRLR
jgi:arsenate reductase-like glutaredoxin family protein